VRVHPETSERSLLLGGMARSVVGLRPHAGRELIAVLEQYATQPEYTMRWRWREGDLVIWDNQATMHYAIRDYGDAVRRALRITVAGQITVGIDGRRGRSISSVGERSDGR
jgi:taurine dioxygenase